MTIGKELVDSNAFWVTVIVAVRAEVMGDVCELLGNDTVDEIGSDAINLVVKMESGVDDILLSTDIDDWLDDVDNEILWLVIPLTPTVVMPLTSTASSALPIMGNADEGVGVNENDVIDVFCGSIVEINVEETSTPVGPFPHNNVVDWERVVSAVGSTGSPAVGDGLQKSPI